MTTLKKLAEQIIRITSGGHISTDTQVHRKEVELLIQQALNSVLKLETVQLHMGTGEYTPAHALIATYSSVPIIGIDGSTSDTITCTEIADDAFALLWETDLGSEWATPTDGGWLIAAQDVSIVITQTIVSGNIQYWVLIQSFNMTLESGVTEESIVDFVEACGEGGYIQFTTPGDDTGIPLLFAKIGISSFTAADGDISFNYTPALVTGISDAVIDAVADTHTTLALGEDTYSVAIANLSCCEVQDEINAKTAAITLPAQPINLPRGQGVWRVYDAANPIEDQYIPIASGRYSLHINQTHNGLADYWGGKICYEYFSRDKLAFNRTVGEMPAEVEVQLLVVDPATLESSDILPIPADMEQKVIEEVLKLLSARYPQDNVNDKNDAR